MIKAKDYFDPQVYERMAQIRANAALQQGDIRAKQSLGNAELFSNLIQQLAQLGTKAYQAKEASDYFTPKEYTVGDQRPIGGEKVVRTDLLDKPITPTVIPQYQEQGTFNPMTDPSRLMQGRMSQNPQLAQMAQTGIENLLMQQPKYQELSAGAFGKQINPFSPAPDIQVPNKPTVTKPSYSKRNVLDPNGKIVTKKENNITYALNEQYDRNTGEPVPNSTTWDKVDDQTYAPQNPFYGNTRLIKSYQDSFNADPSIKSFKEQGLSLGAVNGLIEQANKGNQVSAAALGVKMAKVMGEVGMLSENDVTRYVQAKSLTRGAADKLTKWIGGVPTEATLGEIQQIANILREQFTTRIQPVVDLHANQMAQGMGIDLQTARNYLSAEQLTNPISPAKLQQKQKQVVKKQYSPSANKTKLIYDDGTEEILDGKK